MVTYRYYLSFEKIKRRGDRVPADLREACEALGRSDLRLPTTIGDRRFDVIEGDVFFYGEPPVGWRPYLSRVTATARMAFPPPGFYRGWFDTCAEVTPCGGMVELRVAGPNRWLTRRLMFSVMTAGVDPSSPLEPRTAEEWSGYRGHIGHRLSRRFAVWCVKHR